MSGERGPSDEHGMDGERVVLVDEAGEAVGTALKSQVHHADTPLHLAFSCHVVDERGRTLVTRRALDKPTFPGVWTNTVCGHPGPGEPLADAVVRRARTELGLAVPRPRLVLPRFRYRAQMGGVVEYELCPVFVALVPDGADLDLDPTEVADARWVPWSDLVEGRVELSPWAAEQVPLLAAVGPDPAAWPTGDPAQLPPAARI